MTSHRQDLLGQYVRRITLDLVLVPCAFYLAWFIRFDGHPSFQELETLTWYLLPVAVVYIIINGAFGIYRHLWAFASFRDIILLSEATSLGTLILIVFNLALTGYRNCRFSVGGLIIGGLLTLILSTTFKYRRQLIAIFFAAWPRPAHTNPERVLIVGVNETAQQLATQIYLGRSKANYELVGFVDDDPYHNGMSVSGVEILGTTQQLPSLVRDKHIDVIVIARRPADQEQMWRLVSTCRETSAQVKVLPDLTQVVDGCYEDPLALRDVSMDDILGRMPISANTEVCQQIVADKIVLVTGAAGSIGSELCRQVLCFKPRLLVALDNNETGLYELNLELNPDRRSPVQLVIADVSDWHKMNRVFQQHKPQVVFHAAAYKHVPLVECHPDEALRVNVMGTAIVSEAAHEHGAERFVFISTDKAVNPSSVMGASKRIGELWTKAMSERSQTIFTAVRFGNVICSRGSVIPTFTQQIERGGPVTVTHPEMHRYFISIPEAVSLVLQAATFSQGGEVFMLEMGEEISILKLAERMIRLKGLRVHRDIEIKFTGIRPGEKLHEELAFCSEPKCKTSHPRIYSLQCPDGLVDHDTLLGVISILMDCLRLPGGEQCVRTGIFQIASCDIDGFLNDVTGLDLMRDWRRLPDSVAAKWTVEGQTVRSAGRSRTMEEGRLPNKGMSQALPAAKPQGA